MQDIPLILLVQALELWHDARSAGFGASGISPPGKPSTSNGPSKGTHALADASEIRVEH